MYEKNGEKYFIVDSHSHFWDASRENWKPGAEQYAKGWIDCFYGYHQLGPPETHWDYEKYLKVTPDDFERDMFIEGHVDYAIFQSTYLKEWYTTGFNTAGTFPYTVRTTSPSTGQWGQSTIEYEVVGEDHPGIANGGGAIMNVLSALSWFSWNGATASWSTR